jgi:hypothetical protein
MRALPPKICLNSSTETCSAIVCMYICMHACMHECMQDCTRNVTHIHAFNFVPSMYVHVHTYIGIHARRQASIQTYTSFSYAFV